MEAPINMLHTIESSILANLRNADVSFWTAREQEARNVLSTSTQVGEEPTANNAWYLMTVSAAYSLYCNCFSRMQQRTFYSAWCDLERLEITLADLARNPFYDGGKFLLDFLSDRVTAFQSLFPYRIFFSPEMIVRRRECGICGAVRTPWDDCGHEIGKVYMGRVCTCLAKEVELLSISLVTNPVQKYSVGFSCSDAGEQVDQYDYSTVEFVVDRLASPFHSWSFQKAFAYHPHSMFSNIADDDLCPCKTGRSYLNCCRSKPGVVQPHLEIDFEVPPPPELPHFQLPKL